MPQNHHKCKHKHRLPPACLLSEISFFVMIPRRCSSLVLVTGLGILLLTLAFNMTRMSEHSMFQHYALAKKSFALGNAGVLSEDRIHYITRLFMKTTAAPITDPPWMKHARKPVGPFRSAAPHPFLRDYVIANPHVCRNASVDLLIVIHSAVLNFQRRRMLRETWAALDNVDGLSVRRVFALGRGQFNRQSQVLVNTEQADFGDIVQGDFLDTYFNLTLKAVTTLRWINDHCLHARFILKADDDAFVNVFNLAEKYLQRLAGRRHTVMCYAKGDNASVIIRDPRSTWYVPPFLLAGRTHWPPFCSGFVVIMTPDNIPELYRASFAVPYVPVDDGYVYGLLPLGARNYTLHYLNIGGELVLADGGLLPRYQTSPTSAYLAGTATREDTFLKLWHRTVEGLSTWGKLRASLPQIRVNVSAVPF